MAESQTAPQLLHRNLGHPPPKWPLEPYAGHCATCGAPVAEGVPTAQIDNPTFSRHSEFFRGSHVCVACAWLYSDPKGIRSGDPDTQGAKHRAWLAYGDVALWPTVSQDAATPKRPSWRSLLGVLEALPPSTPVAGLLTKDTKPRLWPMVQLTTRARFGLYVHLPELDLSAYTPLDLPRLIEACALVEEGQRLGYSTYQGQGLSPYYQGSLYLDHTLALATLTETRELETALATHRPYPELKAAQLIATLPAKERKDAQRDAQRRTKPHPAAGPGAPRLPEGREAHQGCLGLV